MNGHEEDDPVKLAQALVTIAGMEHPPSRFIALAGIVELAKQKAKMLHDQANAFQELSSSLAFDDA
jgi:hypothetical protein